MRFILNRLPFRIVWVLCAILVSCTTPKEKAVILAEEIDRSAWGNWMAVIELATEAIEADPTFAWPYAQRGTALAYLGRYTDALRDYDTAIRLRPDLDPAYTDRAIVYIRVGRLDDAERDLAFSLTASPNDMKNLITMAEVQSLKNRPESACRLLKRAFINGFKDIKGLEQNKNFENLTYSDCYDALMRR